jgi:hypothetical protein
MRVIADDSPSALLWLQFSCRSARAIMCPHGGSNTVHERICSRAADVLSVAVSGPGRRCSVVERADPDVARSTVRPTLMWPDRVL